jgi:hypothetical protein
MRQHHPHKYSHSYVNYLIVTHTNMLEFGGAEFGEDRIKYLSIDHVNLNETTSTVSININVDIPTNAGHAG